jgi:thymidylate synthase
MNKYHEIIRHVLAKGEQRQNRTGTDTLSVFNYNYEVDLAEGFPLLTSKRISWKNIIIENLWFLSGSRNVEKLHRHNVKFWDHWADDNGDIPYSYGAAWRKFGAFHVDQIGYIVEKLKTDPNSRRMVVSAWDPALATTASLPPCHAFWVVNTTGGRLNLHLTQRSCDIGLGLPYNIAGYAFLMHLLSNITKIPVGIFAHSIVDAHIYINHIESLSMQLRNQPRQLPRLVVDSRVDSINAAVQLLNEPTAHAMHAFNLLNYAPHGVINMPVAV